jgi:hypothetical protein
LRHPAGQHSNKFSFVIPHHEYEKIMHKFLSADPARIGRPDVPPCSDAVDEELIGGTPEELKRELIEILSEDLVRHRISDGYGVIRTYA